MSWLFSRALVEAYSGESCSDGEPFVQSNGNPTQQAYLSQDRMTAFSRLSRFGMTFALLTEGRGEELLTLYLAGFPVKTSAQQDTAPVSPAVDQDSGRKWQGLLGKYDHVTRSWKTAQCSLLADLEQCLEIWPRWGLMRDGVSYQQQTLVRHISENESGLWATPMMSDWKLDCTLPAIYRRMEGGRHPIFPTPTTGGGGGERSAERAGTGDLNFMARTNKWPTPRLNDYKGEGQQMIRKDGKSRMDQLCFNVESQETGRLNPTWVEWLMGWPLEWTDLKPLETDKCQEWQQQHSNF